MHHQHIEVTGGVDTHGEVHVAAVVDSTARILGTETFPATAAGYRRLLRWLERHGTLVKVGVEGTASYGAGLTRYLASEGVGWSRSTGPTGSGAVVAASPTLSMLRQRPGQR